MIGSGGATEPPYHRGLKGIRYLTESGAAARSDGDKPAHEVENGHRDTSTDFGRRESHWLNMFDALVEYKSIHGNTLVPATYPDNPQLGNWVDNQRQQYRMRFQADPLLPVSMRESMTDERIEKLNAVGFVWNLNDLSWNMRFEELRDYVSEHGNAVVPLGYAKNESLALWVAKQRRNYKAGQGDERTNANGRAGTALSEDRIQKLEAIGFIWEVHEAQWFERLEELKVYRMNHRDTLVPKKYSPYPFLGRWVDKQRADYKRFQRRKELEEKWKGKEISDEEDKKELEKIRKLSTGMTEKRIELLEAEDFIWDVNAYLWELKFNELCSFVALNGHAVLRERAKGSYDPLARWATVQRENYKKYLSGEHTTLTEERIQKLNSIGFLWDTPSRRRSRAKRVNA